MQKNKSIILSQIMNSWIHFFFLKLEYETQAQKILLANLIYKENQKRLHSFTDPWESSFKQCTFHII